MRVRILSFLVILSSAATSRAQEDPARVSAALSASSTQCFVGQPVDLTFTIAVERRFLHDNLLQLFRRHLDVPVQARTPWSRSIDGARWMPASGPSPQRRMTLSLDGEITSLERVDDLVRDGITWVRLAARCRVVPVRAGPLRMPAATIHYAYASRFREDLLNGRVAEDRQDGTATTSPLTLTVRALPTQGRPAGFTGAVGAFALHARAATTDVIAGRPFQFTLILEGPGNLPSFPAPDLGSLPGLHVLGTIDDRAPGTRTIQYDLAATSPETTGIPAIAVPYFDTETARYAAARSAPIPLRVRADPDALVAPKTARVQGLDDIFGLKSEHTGSARAPAPLLVALLAALPWLLALGLRSWRGSGARHRRTDRARVRQVVARCHERLQDQDPADALAELLAVFLACPPHGVHTHDLADRLRAAAVPQELAHRTAVLMEQLVSHRYGGESPTASRNEVRDVVDALARALG